MAEREYKRLSRARSRTAFGIITTSRSSLWLGKDHLLCIDTNGYTEAYKRFFFRDIQAVLIRRTERWKIVALVMGVLASVFGAFMLMALNSREAALAWVMGSITAFWLVGILIDLLRGPSCTCHVRTAVQTEHLPSLDRVGRARKALARLRPLIAEAQGQLAPEEVTVRMQAWLVSGEAVGAGPESPARYVVDDPNAPPRILS